MYSWHRCSPTLWVASSLDWLFPWLCRSFSFYETPLVKCLLPELLKPYSERFRKPFPIPMSCSLLSVLISAVLSFQVSNGEFGSTKSKFLWGDNLTCFNSSAHEHSFSSTFCGRIWLFSSIFFFFFLLVKYQMIVVTSTYSCVFYFIQLVHMSIFSQYHTVFLTTAVYLEIWTDSLLNIILFAENCKWGSVHSLSQYVCWYEFILYTVTLLKLLILPWRFI